MSEEFRCGKFFRDGATVDGDERLSGTLAELMDAVGYILFTRSAGTIDQYRHCGGGNQSYIIIKLLGGITFSFQIVGRRSTACIFLMGTFSFSGTDGLFWGSSGLFHSLTDFLQKLVRIYRLGNVVAGT